MIEGTLTMRNSKRRSSSTEGRTTSRSSLQRSDADRYWRICSRSSSARMQG